MKTIAIALLSLSAAAAIATLLTMTPMPYAYGIPETPAAALTCAIIAIVTLAVGVPMMDAATTTTA